MAALGQRLVTLADVAKNKNSMIGKVAEVLMLENPMLQDIPYMECNKGATHEVEMRSGLPQVYYRKANQAIPFSKTTTEQRNFGTAHFESKSGMDAAVAELGGKDRLAFNRWNQAQGHIQAIANEHADLTIYGTPFGASGNNQKSAGLMDVYSTLAAAEPTSRQIIDAGGTGSDNTSILKVHWGEHSVFGIYPQGTQAGLKRTDRSEGGRLVQIQGLDQNGNPGTFWGYEEQFEVDHGLVVKDYRQAARIANIDTIDLFGMNPADLIDLMISADYRIHTKQNGKGIWYVNRTIEAILHKQALTKVGVGGGLSFDNYQGQKVLTFLGDPIRRSDALLNSEARVIA
jgi:hypothetical protein